MSIANKRGMNGKQNSSESIRADRKSAFLFIIFLGIVSLFGDTTYEGARSVTGPFLSTLGANAAAVGLIAGLGEFMGYALRLGSGYVADRSGRYWTMLFIGYGLLLSVPMLALATNWQVCAILIVAERVGKAIRTPARDTILSHSAKQVGRGWGFAVHEAVDQVGAIVGPLIFSAVIYLNLGFRGGFAVMIVPAILTLFFLARTRMKFPSSEKFEVPPSTSGLATSAKLSGVFWLYSGFTFVSVAGFANFQLISYHFRVESIIPDAQIPIFYAVAMGVDAVVALIIGKIYDRAGLVSLIAIPLLTLPIPVLAFSHSQLAAVAGIVLWGAVMGIQVTIMRAAIADLTPFKRRAFAYGIFNAVYGGAWLFGSIVMGLLYELSTHYIFLFVAAMEVISVPLIIKIKRTAMLNGIRN